MSHLRRFQRCLDGYHSKCHLKKLKAKNTVHAILISKCSFLTFISILFSLPCAKEYYFYKCLINVEVLSHFT